MESADKNRELIDIFISIELIKKPFTAVCFQLIIRKPDTRQDATQLQLRLLQKNKY